MHCQIDVINDPVNNSDKGKNNEEYQPPTDESKRHLKDSRSEYNDPFETSEIKPVINSSNKIKDWRKEKPYATLNRSRYSDPLGTDWSKTASSATLNRYRYSDTSETKEWRCNTMPYLYKQTKGAAAKYDLEDGPGEKLFDNKNTSHLKQMVLTHNCVEQSPCNLTEPCVAKPPSEMDSSKYKDWSLKKEIRSEDNRIVCGITVLDSMVYVVSQDNNNISVYSATELIFLKNLAVDRLINPNDIVSCKFDNCLYVYDWGTACIFRVKDGVKMEQIIWSTGKDVGCLSVTTEHTVLLAGHLSGKLKEYTSNGKLIRSIELKHGLKPWHAIRLDGSNTQYLICEGDSSSAFHRVCLVDLNGNVINSFGGVMGYDKEHLCGPYHLAVNESGCILVTDCNNSRIVLLSSDLKYMKEFVPSSANLLRRARRMYLDEDASRLYVADNAKSGSQTKDGRILVFSNNYCGIDGLMV